MQCTCAIMSPVAYTNLRYFSTLPHKRHDFRKKKVFEYKKGASVFYTTSGRNTSHSEKNRARYDKKMYFSFRVNYTLFLSATKETWIFWADFRKKVKISNFMKIRPVAAEFTFGQRDMTKLIVAFHNLRTRIKKGVKRMRNETRKHKKGQT